MSLRRNLVVALVGLLGAGWWMAPQQGASPTVLAPLPVHGLTREPPAIVHATARVDDLPVDGVLVPVDAGVTPASSAAVNQPQMAHWRELAADNDRQAACELAKAAMRCRTFLSGHVSTDFDGNIVTEHYEENVAYCAQVPEDDTDRAWAHLLRAAELGDRRALYQWYMEPPLDRERPLRDIEGWTAHRERSGALLEQAVQRGDIEFLALQLLLGTGVFNQPFQVVTDAQRIEAVAAIYVLERLQQHPEWPVQLALPMGDVQFLHEIAAPAERAQARARANQLYPMFEAQMSNNMPLLVRQTMMQHGEWDCSRNPM